MEGNSMSDISSVKEIIKMQKKVASQNKNEQGEYANELYWHREFPDYEAARQAILASVKQSRDQDRKQ